MPIYLFLFDFEFPPGVNPPDAKMRFEEELMAFLRARRVRVLLGQQGGCAYTYGVVHRKRWGVKETDRQAFADWIKKQPLRCTARLGRLEEDTPTTDLVREITESRFEVDNL